MKGLILEVLTVESVTVVDVAEMGRRKKRRGPRTAFGESWWLAGVGAMERKV